MYPHLNKYHIDPKKGKDYTEADGMLIRSEHPPDAFKDVSYQSLVWRPINESVAAYDAFFTSILDAALPCIVDIDEISNMVFGDGRVPRGLSLLLSEGRSLGIHVLGGMQKIAKSPRDFIGQSTYLVSFYMQREYDRNTIAKELDIDPRLIKDLKKYEYYAANTDTGVVKKFKDKPGELSGVLSIL